MNPSLTNSCFYKLNYQFSAGVDNVWSSTYCIAASTLLHYWHIVNQKATSSFSITSEPALNLYFMPFGKIDDWLFVTQVCLSCPIAQKNIFLLLRSSSSPQNLRALEAPEGSRNMLAVTNYQCHQTTVFSYQVLIPQRLVVVRPDCSYCWEQFNRSNWIMINWEEKLCSLF